MIRRPLSAAVSFGGFPPSWELRPAGREGSETADLLRAMHALIALQRADGSWDLTTQFAEAVQSNRERIEAALNGAAGERDLTRSAWATALAIAWLRTHARAFEDQWQRVAAKGRRWLDEVPAVPPRGTSWLETAERFVATP